MLSPLLGQISLIFDTDFGEGSGDRYLNHLYTIEKWHVQQESIRKRLHDGVLQRPNKLFTFAAFFKR